MLTCWIKAFLSTGSVGTVGARAAAVAVVGFVGGACVGLFEEEEGLGEVLLLSDPKLRLSREDMVSLCCEDAFLGIFS